MTYWTLHFVDRREGFTQLGLLKARCGAAWTFDFGDRREGFTQFGFLGARCRAACAFDSVDRRKRFRTIRAREREVRGCVDP